MNHIGHKGEKDMRNLPAPIQRLVELVKAAGAELGHTPTEKEFQERGINLQGAAQYKYSRKEIIELAGLIPNRRGGPEKIPNIPLT